VLVSEILEIHDVLLYPWYLNLIERKNMIKRVCLFFMALFIVSNSVLFSKLNDDINISLREKQVQELSQDGLTLVFYLDITNSSSKTYYLSGYSYRFIVEQKEYIRLQTPLEQGLKIEALNNTLIALPVKITYDLLFNAVIGLKQNKIVQCYIMGEMAFSGGRRDKSQLSFAFTGEFPIYKVPEIELKALKSKTLTIGGADLDFIAQIRNPNGFEIWADDGSYEIMFGGHLVKAGRITEDIEIGESCEKEIMISLLLNFFDVGRDVYAILQQGSINCNFAGKLELRTVWGQITFPFEVQKKIPIIRTN